MSCPRDWYDWFDYFKDKAVEENCEKYFDKPGEESDDDEDDEDDEED